MEHIISRAHVHITSSLPLLGRQQRDRCLLCAGDIGTCWLACDSDRGYKSPSLSIRLSLSYNNLHSLHNTRITATCHFRHSHTTQHTHNRARNALTMCMSLLRCLLLFQELLTDIVVSQLLRVQPGLLLDQSLRASTSGLNENTSATRDSRCSSTTRLATSPRALVDPPGRETQASLSGLALTMRLVSSGYATTGSWPRARRTTWSRRHAGSASTNSFKTFRVPS